MVYAFIVHSLQTGSSKLLFYKTWGPESDSENSEAVEELSNAGQKICQQRKAQLITVMKEVQSEFAFRKSVSVNLDQTAEWQALNVEGKLPEFEVGFFRVSPEFEEYQDLFTCDKVVLWMGALNTGFTLILWPDENRIAAESMLKQLIKHFHEHCRILTQPSDASHKPEKMLLVTNTYLPYGKIIIANHRLLRQMEKELEAKIKSAESKS